jgi:hypothetical protein
MDIIAYYIPLSEVVAHACTVINYCHSRSQFSLRIIDF